MYDVCDGPGPTIPMPTTCTRCGVLEAWPATCASVAARTSSTQSGATQSPSAAAAAELAALAMRLSTRRMPNLGACDIHELLGQAAS